MSQTFLEDIPEFLEIQRNSFLRILDTGLIEALETINPISPPLNCQYGLRFYPSEYVLLRPQQTAEEAFLQGKTYGCKIYVPASIVHSKIKEQPRTLSITHFQNSFTGSLPFASFASFASQEAKEAKEAKEAVAFCEATARQKRQKVSFTKEQKPRKEWVCIGVLPIMSRRGHFIINGSPRIVISQMSRAPGLYYEDGEKIQATVVPTKGAWFRMSIKVTKKGETKVWVRMTPYRKMPYKIFLETYKEQESPESFAQSEFLDLAYKDANSKIKDFDKRYAVGQVRRQIKLTIRNPFSYTLGILGRKRLNERLGDSTKKRYLTSKDISKIKESLCLILDQRMYLGPADDIDHLQNRRVKTCGELLQSEMEVGMSRLRKAIKKQLNNYYNPEFSSFMSPKGVLQSKTTSRSSDALAFASISDAVLRSNCFAKQAKQKKQEQERLPLTDTSLFASCEAKEEDSEKKQSLVVEPSGNYSKLNQFTSNNGKISEHLPLTPSKLVSTKAFAGALREFFGSNPLSQYMDQTNPLAEITHKRRLSSLGPGGVDRASAGIAIRGIHPTHYGRICPIETPEGKNAGLVNSMTMFARLNKDGFLQTPYLKVKGGSIMTHTNTLLPAWEFVSTKQEGLETKALKIVASDLPISKTSFLPQIALPTRDGSEQNFVRYNRDVIDFCGVSPIQNISIATSLIPFLEHDDATRALMGSNMQRQAVPLLKSEVPLIRTGLEAKVVGESGHALQAMSSGFISSVTRDSITIDRFTRFVPFFAVLTSFLPFASFASQEAKEAVASQSKTALRSNCFCEATAFCLAVASQKAIARQGKAKGKAKGKGKKLANNENYLINHVSRGKRDYSVTWVKPTTFPFFDQKTQPQETQFLKKISCKSSKGSKIQRTREIQSLQQYTRSNQATICVQRPSVTEGQWVKKGELLGDCSASNRGLLALGKNIVVAYLPMEGFNFEDAIVVSDRLVYEDLYTSIHVERIEFDMEAVPKKKLPRKVKVKANRNTVTAAKTILQDWITWHNPHLKIREKKNLDPLGIIKIGSWVGPDDILVSKVFPIPKILAPSRYLLLAVFKENKALVASQLKTTDTSVRVPKGIHGRVINLQIVYTGKIIPSAIVSTFSGSLLNLLKNSQLKNKQSEVFASKLLYEVIAQQKAKKRSKKETKEVKNDPVDLIIKKNTETVTTLERINLLLDKEQSLQNFETTLSRQVKQRRAQKKSQWNNRFDLSFASYFATDKQAGTHACTHENEENANKVAAQKNMQSLALAQELQSKKELRSKKELQSKKEAIAPAEKEQLLHKKKQLMPKTTPCLFCEATAPFASQEAKGNCEAKQFCEATAPQGKKGNSQKLKQSLHKNPRFQNTISDKEFKIVQVRVYIAEQKKIQVGDKMSGRHGNKGIISTILPREDMPYLPDGTCVDMVLNPLGIPSRMNVGQVFECLLGLAATVCGDIISHTPFDEMYGPEASRSLVYLFLYAARLRARADWLFQPTFPGKTVLFDGRTGTPFEQWVTVGRAYMLKLIHMVDEKIHARSVGSRSIVTQQPVKGRARGGGQRVGEMEVWAFEGFGAAYMLQELLTLKSDDIFGRERVEDTIISATTISANVPETFKMLLFELRGLCLNVQLNAKDYSIKT